MSMVLAEESAMETALDAALGGVRGANPLVGAVILDPQGRLLAVGHHRGAGTPHAEADALAQLEPGQAHGATAVVTLEPCNHQGRMPACSHALVEAGIGRVVYAVDDPDRRAAGGAEYLRSAGVEVQGGVLRPRAEELNRRWLRAVREQRPYTSLHLAQTLDGRIAAQDGTSQWISGPEALEDNHALRSRVDAMLVGTGTVLADNPRLTARIPGGALHPHQPLRVVLGEREVSEDAAIRGDGAWLHLRHRDPVRAGKELHRQGVRHLMVEGGSQVTAAFLAADAVDEITVALAPTILGAGIPVIGDLGIRTLSDALSFDWDPAAGLTLKGRDLIFTLIPRDARDDSSERR
ncbi:bifunctional diaminohydroxyphosphoribosylaminopyrimidine deaminase/5-amino-6-(5-phosphoribosylamino)uracil reductase RibD [Psychromicrobium xiongbiense]|uniref:bifunctional diaminohydroxyphosphoribosylaminopyrimidine deaminase/5-amino-6-(5-phosphoribosylamino)uracil reductase RibD n=1 Tax=Psychromicrobium xiongbiense TaxID=3051184 RepID=UPI002553F2BF|nr:bifunctional diaminohydroxyphosphoribosylaminopyrimidine deaminase/5-amino-6-(5-phosphoribosylamino)uracil reductase RibD [Psychromicrobium sp. YIM S02556]